MDFNINNYNKDRILQLLKLGKNATREEVFFTVLRFLKHVSNDKNINSERKRELIFFFKSCFYKLYAIYGFTHTESMKQKLDQFLMNENYYNQPIVHEVPFKGKVPDKEPKEIAVNVKQTEYTKGLVNPIERETIKKTLVISNKFADSCESSTDFKVILMNPINNVVSLRIASIEMVNCYYAISEYYNNYSFSVETYDVDGAGNINNLVKTTINVNEGSYNISQLSTFINDTFDSSTNTDMLETFYEEIKGKVVFRLKTAPPTPPPVGTTYGFNLYFDSTVEPRFMNIGYLMGFDKTEYIFADDYVDTETISKLVGFNPTMCVDLTGSKFFFIEVNDYNNNAPRVMLYNQNKKYNFDSNDIMAKIQNATVTHAIIFDDGADGEFRTRKYFGPVKLQRLHIRLLDEFGKVVNLNENEFIVTFEVELLNSPYKNILK
jgi:hypothetical protein